MYDIEYRYRREIEKAQAFAPALPQRYTLEMRKHTQTNTYTHTDIQTTQLLCLTPHEAVGNRGQNTFQLLNAPAHTTSTIVTKLPAQSRLITKWYTSGDVSAGFGGNITPFLMNITSVLGVCEHTDFITGLKSLTEAVERGMALAGAPVAPIVDQDVTIDCC